MVGLNTTIKELLEYLDSNKHVYLEYKGKRYFVTKVVTEIKYFDPLDDLKGLTINDIC